MPNHDTLLAQVLELPEPERAEIAYQLILSLDPADPDPRLVLPGEMNEQVGAAWMVELRRRLDAFDRGESSAQPWEEILPRLRQSLRRDRMP
jgi:putative addiction module component (TIGR02574 family)